ncbi:OLC1v1006389C1 [Oldenlandia corymbosa var. corymbosa]|uniref:OLC1v1006389C1 n=1 Tax=Oldenlandia corymbosa var. corymbosa TaxID=529605 RepID=A0AAV1DHI1_OLDCO|nr:OLC1v1006389C1 [Oldenlandia corymbosa var. corymbosa]
MYLVESSSSSTSSKKEGKLQVIFRGDCNPPRDNYLYTTEFAVYQLDIVNRNWERISTLDGDTIFVGSNASMSISSVEAERSGIKSNCIYFTYHYITELGASERGGKDMGIYNMQDESVERFDGVVNQSLLSCLENQGPDSFVCPPLWIAPGN